MSTRHSQGPLNTIGPEIKAKDVRPGMTIVLSTGSIAPRTPRRVLAVVRAVDQIERVRALIGASKRPSIDALCDLSTELSDAAQAVAICGREARLIRFDGIARWRSYSSQDELRRG